MATNPFDHPVPKELLEKLYGPSMHVPRTWYEGGGVVDASWGTLKSDPWTDLNEMAKRLAEEVGFVPAPQQVYMSRAAVLAFKQAAKQEGKTAKEYLEAYYPGWEFLMSMECFELLHEPEPTIVLEG